MEGWLHKRGPTVDYRWARRWCVLTKDSLDYFVDEHRQQRKGSIRLKPVTCAVAFQASSVGQNPQAPGEAGRHWQEKPYGFVLDVDPDGGRSRHFYYFEAENSGGLQAWTAAFDRLRGGEAAAGAAVPSARAPPAPERELSAARGSILRALQGASSRSRVAEAATMQVSKRASSALVSSLLTRCLQEEDAPVDQFGRLAKAQSESKRCSKMGSMMLTGLSEERRGSQATVLASTRQSLFPSAGTTDFDDKVAYIRASQSNIRGFFAVGRASTMQLQLCPEVCGESSSDTSSDSSSDSDSEEEKRPRKVRNPERSKALSEVERNPDSFKTLSDEFRGDREIVLAAVNGNPDMLAFASEALRSDREVVMASVRRDGRALQHSLKLQGDREIVMAAALQNTDAMKYADEGLKQDDSLVVF